MPAQIRTSLILIVFLCAALLLRCGPPQPSPEDGGGERPCIGAEGCPCYPNMTCERGLACRGGKCRPSEAIPEIPQEESREQEFLPEEGGREYCEPGTRLCRCLPTGKCQEGLRCDDGTCQTCTQGSAGCACKDDGTCSGGLACQQGTCLGCVGEANCPCYGNNRCDKGLRCQPSPNNIGTCKPCQGDKMDDCACASDKDCGDKLICLNKQCKDIKALHKIPQNPKCYHPCEGDSQRADGTLVLCHTKYKLADGCGVGQICEQGSCIQREKKGKLSANKYPFCSDASDCPDWQTCIQGRCYSTCTSDSQCIQGFQCYRYVCRRTCTTTKNPCSTNESCDTRGTDEGICLPKANRYKAKPPKTRTLGTFKMPITSYTFSNYKTSDELYITNKSSFPTSFQISRVSDNLGSKNPLSWLRFDLCQTYSSDGKSCKKFQGKPSAAEPFKIASVGAQKMVILRISNVQALLRSVREGTWKLKKVRDDCKKKMSTTGTKDIVCYPYNTAKGYEILSYSESEAPVPTGITESNFVINVQEKGNNTLQGQIVTSQTLQYPGNPQIILSFDSAFGSKKLSFLTTLQATVEIGGRYHIEKSGGCADSTSFSRVTIPWLIPGFTLHSTPAGLFRQRFACRDKTTPRSPSSGATEKEKKEAEAYNQSLSASNAIPNGWKLRRQLKLVDGALIENRYIFLLYREDFASFFASEGQNNTLSKDFSTYGYIWLERTTADLEAKDFVGHAPPPSKKCTSHSDCGGTKRCISGLCKVKSQLKQVQCSPAVVSAAIGLTLSSPAEVETRLSPTQLNNLVVALIEGQSPAVSSDATAQIKKDSNGDYCYSEGGKSRCIHYYCEDTKLLNGGPKDNTACPVGSKVIFFEVEGQKNSDLKKLSCQSNGDCTQRFLQFQNRSDYRPDVPYRCASANEVFCNKDRNDLREGKIFFKPASSTRFITSYKPLRLALIQAFRYRLKFANRSGTNLGFTPTICQGNASQTPYCYDPKTIESIEERVNCLEAIYTSTKLYPRLPSLLQLKLKDTLEHAFSYKNRKLPDGSITTDFGFETLNAELRIMLGDEAYVKASSSRYDLAGSRLISFEGDKFEPNGLKLTGALGFEMHNLYLSTQYYQSILDRFFSQASVIFRSFSHSHKSFITPASVTSYFQKLLLASTRKARSWSQIARRYHQLNRADLARHVIERAYSATYLEKTIFSRLLREMMLSFNDSKYIDQITTAIDKISLTYKAALLDMEEVYKKLSLSMNFLGIPEGYIPFPAMDSLSALRGTINAFQVALSYAKEKMAIAKAKEQIALQSKRSFDTDAASFQNELTRIEQNYENQLLSLCGGIQDGNRIFPAIPKYIYLLDKNAQQLGNPCGRVKSGQIYNATARLEQIRVGFESLLVAFQNIDRQMGLEEKRIQRFCNAQFSLAKLVRKRLKRKISLQETRYQARRWVEKAGRILNDLMALTDMSICRLLDASSDCPTAWVAYTIGVLAIAGRETAIGILEEKVHQKEIEVATLNKNLEEARIVAVCNICNDGSVCNKNNKCKDGTTCQDGVARIESQVRLQQLENKLLQYQLEAMRVEYTVRIASSDLLALRQRARRLFTEQAETTQMAINAQAARNNPNIRIYKNDAILNAERTFKEAIREAYRTTLIYEYYTGTSYKHKGDLYLIRMVASGDKNLEAYLSQLEQAFREFEEQHGKPDVRVAIVSLRDDILNIPRSADDGTPLTLQQRVNRLQKLLVSTERLNSEGHTVFPFSLSVTAESAFVSPITVNHKILYVEAEIVGSDIGDTVGRLYLRQKGTGVVRLPGNNLQFHALPERTAVLNPFFNGTRVFTPELYQNYRLRDRPLGNTHWELLLNQVSEKVNQDINLNSINDIKLYLYYHDFTEER